MLLKRDWSEAHTTCGGNGRQEGGECSYYDLHCNLNDALLHRLHLLSVVLSSGLLADPVLEGSDLLDVLLLRGILLLGSDVDPIVIGTGAWVCPIRPRSDFRFSLLLYHKTDTTPDNSVLQLLQCCSSKIDSMIVKN